MNFLKKEVYVPIGCNCSVSSYLRHIGYRIEAFPFDWTVTPIQSAIELLNNGFEDFFKKENLTFLKPTNRLLFKENGIEVEVREDMITPVYDKRYHILFVHDFSEDAINEYIIVKEKYIKRIKRLKKLLSDETIKINFIYDNSEINEWQKEQYEQIEYKFKVLRIEEVENLKIGRDNSTLMSLEELKLNTKYRKFIGAIKKRILI